MSDPTLKWSKEQLRGEIGILARGVLEWQQKYEVSQSRLEAAEKVVKVSNGILAGMRNGLDEYWKASADYDKAKGEG